MSILKNINKNSILIGIAIIAIIITGGLILANSSKSFSLPNFFGPSDSQIGKKVIDYINNNQLSSTPASLVSVSDASGLFKVKIKIGTNSFDSYATKDGKFLFPQAFDMTPKPAATTAKQAASNTNTPPAATQAAASIQKADKPQLEAFIVSGCPYGLQMQRALAEAVKTQPALASDITIRYIGTVANGTITSMHSPAEAQENLRQICIRDEQPTKYWNYVSCYMKKATGTMPNGMPLGDSPTCQSSTGIDTAKLNACVSDPTRGLADAQKDFALDSKYNVSGSPTVVLNGVDISQNSIAGRSADAVRAMICAGSTTQPSFCSTKLNTTTAAASFSATYASAGSTGSSTQCAPAQ
jgi:hypothetical protein